MDVKDRIIRVDTYPPLFFGPFTKEEAEDASAALQERFLTECGTYMLLPGVDDPIEKAAEFNHPDYVE